MIFVNRKGDRADIKPPSDSLSFFFGLSSGQAEYVPLTIWTAIQTVLKGRKIGWWELLEETGETGNTSLLILYSDERFPIAAAVQREYYILFGRKLTWSAALDAAAGVIENWVIPLENHCWLWRLGHYLLPFVVCGKKG